MTRWESSGHLPPYKKVIGAVRALTGTQSSTEKKAKFVSEKLVKHWSERNVYPKHATNVTVKLTEDYKEFVLVRKLLKRANRKVTQATIDRYEVILEKRDN